MKRVAIILVLMVVFLTLTLPAIAHALPVWDNSQYREWAQKWHRIAHIERRILVRHTKALGLPKPRKVPTVAAYTIWVQPPTPPPEPGEPPNLPDPPYKLTDWKRYGADNKRVALRFRVRIDELHHRLTHPGGSSNGVRWMPLARYLKWPRSALPMLAKVIMRESSGRTMATSSANCRGLTQLHPGWFSGTWAIRGKHHAFNAYDPEANLRAALGIWLDQHRSFLPAWSLTAW